MITITEFKLSDDLSSITLKATTDGEFSVARIYVGDNYLTDTYYSIPLLSGQTEIDVTILASTLGDTAPMTDIYIAHVENKYNEVAEAGIWSLEAPSQCLADKVLDYPNDCKNCKGINDINVLHMNIEATVIYLAQQQFEKALLTRSRVVLVCENFGQFTIDPESCPGGIGCWIIQGDFVVS